jgi:hypothetical protein
MPFPATFMSVIPGSVDNAFSAPFNFVSGLNDSVYGFKGADTLFSDAHLLLAPIDCTPILREVACIHCKWTMCIHGI